MQVEMARQKLVPLVVWLHEATLGLPQGAAQGMNRR